jgi:hypothetical protein
MNICMHVFRAQLARNWKITYRSKYRTDVAEKIEDARSSVSLAVQHCYVMRIAPKLFERQKKKSVHGLNYVLKVLYRYSESQTRQKTDSNMATTHCCQCQRYRQSSEYCKV